MGGDYHPGNKPSVLRLRVLDQAAAVQNTWYEGFPVLRNLKIYQIIFAMLTNNETLELEITVDGVTETLTVAAVANTGYLVNLSGNTGALIHWYTPYVNTVWNQPLYECKSLYMRIRKTTAVGAGALRLKTTYGEY